MTEYLCLEQADHPVAASRERVTHHAAAAAEMERFTPPRHTVKHAAATQ